MPRRHANCLSSISTSTIPAIDMHSILLEVDKTRGPQMVTLCSFWLFAWFIERSIARRRTAQRVRGMKVLFASSANLYMVGVCEGGHYVMIMSPGRTTTQCAQERGTKVRVSSQSSSRDASAIGSEIVVRKSWKLLIGWEITFFICTNKWDYTVWASICALLFVANNDEWGNEENF